MSDITQDNELAPSADEVGDGGANIDAQVEEGAKELENGAVEDADVEQPKSADKQAAGDFPIMT